MEKLYGQESLPPYGEDPAHVVSQAAADSDETALAKLRVSNKVYFVKTHELPSDDSPAILLVRDGRDAMVSFAHYIEDCGVVRWSPVGQFVANLKACRQELLHGRPRFDQLLRRILTSIGRATTKRGARGQQTVPWSSLNCSSANPRARVKVHWMPYDSD